MELWGTPEIQKPGKTGRNDFSFCPAPPRDSKKDLKIDLK
ncbi:hypothetical protein LEP1GSC125_3985 [Leptospira mayottensis 200901122]|uniref:Uncharacterized protein n=1 Tax=Leptospira mayottensis 200901122 TaxID=1193010 RepID=A0AA87MQI6_9LEPT|nr:hypothetical protein LEP1GSC125_3985 [Leptospira mayottensis 200901122]